MYNFFLSKIQIIAFKVYQIVIFILLSFIFVIFEPKVHIYCQYSPFVHSIYCHIFFFLWVPISSIGKVSDGCIRDLGFNPRLHQILIGVLV